MRSAPARSNPSPNPNPNPNPDPNPNPNPNPNQVCACPFCLNRGAEGTWGSKGAGVVTWTSGPEAAISPVTGGPVLVWRGGQANGNSVEHS